MSKIGTNDTGDTGNTLVSPNKTKKRIRARGWCMTLNNYSDNELTQLHNIFIKKDWKYIIGEEIGEEKKTPHLQIYIKAKNPISFNTLKKLNNRLNIRKANGTLQQNYIYCSKDNKFKTNIICRSSLKNKVLNQEYKNVKWKKWQMEIINLIHSKPDNRKIYWYYDHDGNIGKSYLCKYICTTEKGVIIGTGKKNDIFNQINQNIENENEIRVIILDIPRSDREFINYGAIEQIKNGCIYSGKYEGGVCIYPIPHVIIFSNDEPDKNAWSKDRYNIIELSKDNDI